jgi:hypothetical protein
MTLKEYFYIVFHPKRAFSKLHSYISILELRLEITPTNKENVVDPKTSNGLLVLGNDTIIQDTGFTGDNLLVVHPDAKHVLVTNCYFVGKVKK